MPSLILSNPLGADDAQRIGLSIREYAIGEIVTVNDFAAVTLIRTGYALAYGTGEDVLLTGDAPPNDSIGTDGQWYLDTQDEVLWGPKTGGLWPSDPIRPDRGIAHLAIDGNEHLIVTYSTGTSVDLGNVQGPGATIAIGAITTLPAGSQATADNSGTEHQVVLNLGIPQGDKGDKGDKGNTGDPGPGFGGGLVIGPPDPTNGISATITSPWGLRDNGTAYYDPAGALPAEAALLVPDPLTGQFALFRPGASSTTLLDDAVVALLLNSSSKTRTQLNGILAGAYVPMSSLGTPSGVATLDSSGKVPTAQLPASVGSGGGGSGGVQTGAISVAVDPNGVDLDVTITSNWGITDAGQVYYNDQGAVAAEAAVLVPDPDGTGWAVFRPGVAAWPTEEQRVAGFMANPSGLLRASVAAYWGTGTSFPPATTPGLKAGDYYQHTTWGLHVWHPNTGWRREAPLELTKAQRLALATTGLYVGFPVLETDTGGRPWQWSGTQWVGVGVHDFPIAQLHQNTAQTGLAANWVTLTMDTVDIDSHSGWSSGANSRWTCPAGQAGTYRVVGTAAVTSLAASGYGGTRVIKNGLVVPGGATLGTSAPAGGGVMETAETVLTLAVGDYVEIQGYGSSASWATRNTGPTDGLASAMIVERIR